MMGVVEEEVEEEEEEEAERRCKGRCGRESLAGSVGARAGPHQDHTTVGLRE